MSTPLEIPPEKIRINRIEQSSRRTAQRRDMSHSVSRRLSFFREMRTLRGFWCTQFLFGAILDRDFDGP